MAEKTSKALEQKILTLLPLAYLLVSHTIIMTQETARMYWPYMIWSYVLAGVIYFFHRPDSGESLYEYLFSKKIWMHRSAVNDYTLFIFNYVFYFRFLAYSLIGFFLFRDSIISYINALDHAQSGAEPTFFACLAYTVGLLLLGELAYYITHRAYHEIPFLWELHKVHHSAEVMTPLTFIRAHPVDLLIQNFMRLLSIAIATWIFLLFYPNKEGLLTVAGIDAGLFVYYIMGANLHHSHIWFSFGRPLEHIFISPAQHQIHHSTNPKHFDKNYGSMLALWDWIFGSLYIPEKNEKISFGLSKKDQPDYDSTTKLLLIPMIRMVSMLTGKKPPPTAKQQKTLEKTQS